MRKLYCFNRWKIYSSEALISYEKYLLKLFDEENEPERKVYFIFDSLNRAYNIVIDRDFSSLRDLMIGMYNPKKDFDLIDYKTIIMSKLVTRLTELSCYDKLICDS